VLGHRDAFAVSGPAACGPRLRLTAARLEQAGAVWRQVRAPLLEGFEVGFSFQVLDQSRSCRRVRDRGFTTRQHDSCQVHGADGLAFVLHGDPEGATALGGRAEALGYAGLRNALAVELDMWHNAVMGDLWSDHVAVMASGPAGTLTANVSQAVAPARATSLADGRLHHVRLQYFPFVRYDLTAHFSAAPPLTPFLKDGGEQRRMGTFVVYLDNQTAPLVAFPINLNVALDLPEGTAYMGFTGSTGRAWQHHDVLSWYFCEQPGCGRFRLTDALQGRDFDNYVADVVNARRV
jgi:hypothetical protein